MKGLFNVKSSFLLFFLFASCFIMPVFADVEVIDFPLNAEGSVVANYNSTEKVLVISGSGDIEYGKWIALAKQFDANNFRNVYCGWDGNEDFSIKFICGDEEKINLCTRGESGGLFQSFDGNIDFNESVSTAGVTDMSSMFSYAKKFNGDISDWDTSSVTNMSYMFNYAECFNGELSDWDVSSVICMNNMFSNTLNFNSDLSNWDVSKVQNMAWLFKEAVSFNSDISRWDVSNVTDMSNMFTGASNFNYNISNWNVSNVTNMNSMFWGVVSTNLDISKWDTSKVNTLVGTFSRSKIKRINLLNRENVAINAIAVAAFSQASPEFVGFKKFRSSTWAFMPYDYWVSVDNSKFVKENTKGRDKVFEEGKKYVLETQITSYPEVSSYEGVYTGNKLSIDDISHSCVDIVGYHIDGTWAIDFHGHNGIDVGSYTATVTFTPNNTDKYRTPESIDININITKASPNVTVPSGLRGWKNQSLAEVRIPVVDGGVWTFDDESAILSRTGREVKRMRLMMVREFLNHQVIAFLLMM